MDLESVLRNAVTAQRAESLKTSPQLNLGEIILLLQAVPEKDDKEKMVSYDFEYAFPTTLDSWRGSYDELALGFDLQGYGPPASDNANKKEAPTVAELIKELESALGKTFTGWKGGDFTMGKNTPVWVSNPGNAGNTAIVGVKDLGWQVILETKYCEY